MLSSDWFVANLLNGVTVTSYLMHWTIDLLHTFYRCHAVQVTYNVNTSTKVRII